MLAPEELARIEACVNGCAGIGNPAGLQELIIALADLLGALELGPIGPDAAEVQELKRAITVLELALDDQN